MGLSAGGSKTRNGREDRCWRTKKIDPLDECEERLTLK